IGQEKPTLTQFVNVLRAVCNANTSVIFDEAALSSLWLWECERMYVLCQPTRRMQLYVLETCNNAFRMFFPQFVDTHLEKQYNILNGQMGKQMNKGGSNQSLTNNSLSNIEKNENLFEQGQSEREKTFIDISSRETLDTLKEDEMEVNSVKENVLQNEGIRSVTSLSKDLVEQVDGLGIGDNEALTSDGILRLQFDTFSPNSSQRATVIDASIIPANIQLHEMLMEDPNEDRNQRIKNTQEVIYQENLEDGLVNENEFIDKEDLQACNYVGILAFSQTLQRTFMQTVESLQESSTPLFIVDTEGRNGQDFVRAGCRLLNKKVTFCDFPFELSRISTFLDILAEFIVENGFNNNVSLLYFDQCELNKHIAKQGMILTNTQYNSLNNKQMRQRNPSGSINIFSDNIQQPMARRYSSDVAKDKNEEVNKKDEDIELYIDEKLLQLQLYERQHKQVQSFGQSKLTTYPAVIKSLFVIAFNSKSDSELKCLINILFDVFFSSSLNYQQENQIFQPLQYDSLKAREIRGRKDDPELHIEYLYGRIAYIAKQKRGISQINGIAMREILFNVANSCRIAFLVDIQNKSSSEAFLAQFKQVWTPIFTPMMDAGSFKEIALHTLKPVFHNLAPYLISEEVPAFITTSTSTAAVNSLKMETSISLGSQGGLLMIRQLADMNMKRIMHQNKLNLQESKSGLELSYQINNGGHIINNQFISAFSKDGSLNKKQRNLTVAIIESLAQIQQQACSLSVIQGTERSTWGHNGKDPVIGNYSMDHPSYARLINFIQYFGHFLFASVRYQQRLISKLLSSLTILHVFRTKLERLRTTTEQSTTLFQSIDVPQNLQYRMTNMRATIQIRKQTLKEIDNEKKKIFDILQSFKVNESLLRSQHVEKIRSKTEDAMQNLKQLTSDGLHQLISLNNIMMRQSNFSLQKLFELVAHFVVRGDEKERVQLFGVCSTGVIMDCLWEIDVFSVPLNIVKEISVLLEVAYTWNALPKIPIFATVLFQWLKSIVFIALEGRITENNDSNQQEYIKTIVQSIVLRFRQQRIKEKTVELERELMRTETARQKLTQNPDLVNETLQRSRTIVLNAEKLQANMNGIYETLVNDMKLAQNELHSCIGDSILAASYFALSRNFTSDYRRIFIQEYVNQTITQARIPQSTDFDPIAFVNRISFNNLITEGLLGNIQLTQQTDTLRFKTNDFGSYFEVKPSENIKKFEENKYTEFIPNTASSEQTKDEEISIMSISSATSEIIDQSNFSQTPGTDTTKKRKIKEIRQVQPINSAIDGESHQFGSEQSLGTFNESGILWNKIDQANSNSEQLPLLNNQFFQSNANLLPLLPGRRSRARSFQAQLTDKVADDQSSMSQIENGYAMKNMQISSAQNLNMHMNQIEGNSSNVQGLIGRPRPLEIHNAFDSLGRQHASRRSIIPPTPGTYLSRKSIIQSTPKTFSFNLIGHSQQQHRNFSQNQQRFQLPRRQTIMTALGSKFSAISSRNAKSQMQQRILLHSLQSILFDHGISTVSIPNYLLVRISNQLSLFSDNYANSQSVYTRSANELANDLKQDNEDSISEDDNLQNQELEQQKKKISQQVMPEKMAKLLQEMNQWDDPLRFNYSGDQRNKMEIFMRILFATGILFQHFRFDYIQQLPTFENSIRHPFLDYFQPFYQFPLIFDQFEIFTSLNSGGVMKTAGRNSIFKLFGIQHPSNSPYIISLSNTDSYKKIIQALKEVQQQSESTQSDLMSVINNRNTNVKKNQNKLDKKKIKAIFITDVCDQTVDERMLDFLKHFASKSTNCRNIGIATQSQSQLNLFNDQEKISGKSQNPALLSPKGKQSPKGIKSPRGQYSPRGNKSNFQQFSPNFRSISSVHGHPSTPQHSKLAMVQTEEQEQDDIDEKEKEKIPKKIKSTDLGKENPTKVSPKSTYQPQLKQDLVPTIKKQLQNQTNRTGGQQNQEDLNTLQSQNVSGKTESGDQNKSDQQKLKVQGKVKVKQAVKNLDVEKIDSNQQNVRRASVKEFPKIQNQMQADDNKDQKDKNVQNTETQKRRPTLTEDFVQNKDSFSSIKRKSSILSIDQNDNRSQITNLSSQTQVAYSLILHPEPISLELVSDEEYDIVDTKMLNQFIYIPPDTVIILIAKMGPECTFLSLWKQLYYSICIVPNEELFKSCASREIGSCVSRNFHLNGTFNTIVNLRQSQSQSQDLFADVDTYKKVNGEESSNHLLGT
ncbi:MAG: hypothetical protein EZS28_017337, partial [Streblomastix strix]